MSKHLINHAERLRSFVTASKGVDADPDGLLAAADEIDRLQAFDGWDAVNEAINTYDAWMGEDNYEFAAILQKIMRLLKERRDLYTHESGD